MGVRVCQTTSDQRVRPLTKHEIDHRIEQLVSEIAAACEETGPSGDRFRPRWLSPRELVRRMRPFLAQN
jgi:hypothetical protein